MQSSHRLSKIKSTCSTEAPECRPAVLHAAFEEIEKRWGIDWSRVPITRKAYPPIPEWKADQPYGKSRPSTWRIYFHRIFSYMHNTKNK